MKNIYDVENFNSDGFIKAFYNCSGFNKSMFDDLYTDFQLKMINKEVFFIEDRYIAMCFLEVVRYHLPDIQYFVRKTNCGNMYYFVHNEKEKDVLVENMNFVLADQEVEVINIKSFLSSLCLDEGEMR